MRSEKLVKSVKASNRSLINGDWSTEVIFNISAISGGYYLDSATLHLYRGATSRFCRPHRWNNIGRAHQRLPRPILVQSRGQRYPMDWTKNHRFTTWPTKTVPLSMYVESRDGENHDSGSGLTYHAEAMCRMIQAREQKNFSSYTQGSSESKKCWENSPAQSPYMNLRFKWGERAHEENTIMCAPRWND